MTHGFDKDYWESHWREAGGHTVAANPYLVRETDDLSPGTALDAGCGEGAEATWLAGAGWRVTAADISAEALVRARSRAGTTGDRIEWVEADLETWEPDRLFELVTTHYAHPTMPQLDFYDRLSSWVAPGGTLLVVGHRQTTGHGHGHESHDHPPEEAQVTAATVAARLGSRSWDLVTAEEPSREVGHGVLHDVVVRAVRRG